MTSTDTKHKISNFYSSPIGKKIITGITGLVLTLFVVFHAIGNLLLLTSPKAYNKLAHFIDSLGGLLFLVELILMVAIIFHIITGIMVTINNMRSRPIGYQKLKSVGLPSKQSISSRTMIFTGLILLIFLISHLLTFKFGQSDLILINGVEMRNLSKLVEETFHQPIYTIIYSGVMIFLGLHLRHGIWSGLQSLSLINSDLSRIIYWGNFLLSALIVLGFIAIPIVIYFQ